MATATSAGQAILAELLHLEVISPPAWTGLEPVVRDDLARLADPASLLDTLTALKLVTPFQAERLRGGPATALVLGNYHLTERIGAGGAGVVYKAVNRRLRRPVAIKVMADTHHLDPAALPRFLAEIEALGRLRHPNVVAALDAGECDGPNGMLHFLVMEFVDGQDLGAYVRSRGPLPPGLACHLAHQTAAGLAEAHRNGLVHRDVKPTNILVTRDGQARLSDFGIARRAGSDLTRPGAPLGTLDYMAPEQIQSARDVDLRADVYGLGGTLFWCLTGRSPFPDDAPAHIRLVRRLTKPPPVLRDVAPGLPIELEAVLARMMADDPDARFPDMDAVARALSPFLIGMPLTIPIAVQTPETARSFDDGGMTLTDAAARRLSRVLVVDDERLSARLTQHILAADSIAVDVAPDGQEARHRLASGNYDLAVLDMQLPDTTGAELLREIRANPPSPHFKVVMCSGVAEPDEMARMLLAGADDYLSKPVSRVQLASRVRAALTLKDAQDRSDELKRRLLAANLALEQDLSARDGSLAQARQALVLSLAKLAEARTGDPPARLRRLQRYCRALAETAAGRPEFEGRIEPALVRTLEMCVPLIDIGKVALPDHILTKPGKLEPEERTAMESHTTIGADALAEVARRHGFARDFLAMAVDVVRHHHERWDGSGYPDRLVGNAIPLAARIAGLADVYDALRVRRPDRPALSHTAAVALITGAMRPQFQPALLDVFRGLSGEFERIFSESAGG